MNKKFICITKWENFDAIIKNNVWGVKESHKKQIHNGSIGDSLLFYIKSGKYKGDKKDTSIFGGYKVISNVFYDDSKIFKGEETFSYRTEIKQIESIKKPKDFRFLVPKLNIIKNKKRWGLLFWGRAMIEIDDHDYNLILEYLKWFVVNVYMSCKICGVNETDKPDNVCDDCKFSIINNDEILPNM